MGAVLVVDRTPWPDTPDCPFVIELFTASGQRRRGIGRVLLSHCLTEAHGPVALRVSGDNAAALGLYRALGFQER